MPTLRRISRVLRYEGYWGAVGADILTRPYSPTSGGNVDIENLQEDSGSTEAAAEADVVIDLNVRTPLSLVLYVLRGFFHKERSFEFAMVWECVVLGVGRDELTERFRTDFREGRIVLLGCARLGDRGGKGRWAYGVVLAGRDREHVERLGDRILKLETTDV
jgi:hypothetical protein